MTFFWSSPKFLWSVRYKFGPIGQGIRMLKKGTLLKIVPLNTYLSYYLYFFLTECMVCFKQRFTLDTWPYSHWAWDLCAPLWAIWAHPYLWGKFTRQSKLTEKTVKIGWKNSQNWQFKTKNLLAHYSDDIPWCFSRLRSH